jgi:hypothetical protein
MVVKMGDPTELFDILFLNTSVYGYLGILIFVGACLYFSRKIKWFGFVVILVDLLMLTEYLEAIQTTPALAWHMVIFSLGAIMTGLIVLEQDR